MIQSTEVVMSRGEEGKGTILDFIFFLLVHEGRRMELVSILVSLSSSPLYGRLKYHRICCG
jgi:hypothetical protein